MSLREKIDNNGYVVVKNVLDKNDLEHAMELFKDTVSLEEVGGFDFAQTHSSFSNYLRNHNKIKSKFIEIWDTNDLLPSLDCPIVWFSSSIPIIENLHVDQNPYWKRGFHCIQGMIHLSTTKIGGLQIIPKTNTLQFQNKLIKLYPQIINTKEDWLELNVDIPTKLSPVRIPSIAGDMIFWDSRTVHGAYIHNVNDKRPRISFPICMMPLIDISEEVIKKREQAIQENKTLTHWVNKATIH